MRWTRVVICQMLCVVLVCSTPAHADSMPHVTVQQMCFTADLIVAGRHLGDGQVQIEQVFYRSPAEEKEPDTISVPSITAHSRIIDEGLSTQPDAPIQTDRLVLFLQRNKDEQWTPMYWSGQGSQGLIWCDDHACYGYEQPMNPGPYVLRPAEEEYRIPDYPAALRMMIKAGLAQRERWEGIKAIEDPAERAKQMSAYLLPRTAPKGYANAVHLRTEIGEIGPAAVPALVDVLTNAQPEDKLNDAVLILYDIGKQHPGALESAVLPLCKLLENPGPTSLYYILCPLTAARDPRAIPAVRPMLKHDDRQVHAQAAGALAAMNDQASFDAIAELLQKSDDPRQALGYTSDLATALFKLDPARAVPLIQATEAKLGNPDFHNHVSGYYQYMEQKRKEAAEIIEAHE